MTDILIEMHYAKSQITYSLPLMELFFMELIHQRG